MRRLFVLPLLVLLVLVGASPAAAVPPPQVVHSEVVPLGGSTLTVSFSDWPLRADRSLDFTFAPADGIAGRSGTVRAVSPGGTATQLGIVGLLAGDPDMTLARYPRDPDVWGLDAVALPQEGTWRFEFTVRGPEGTSRAELALTAGPRPGPPPALSWAVGLLPWAVAALVLTHRWIRTRPVRRRIGSSWNG